MLFRSYLKPGSPDDLEELPGGWHDTGDICAIDGDNYVRILGRAKRFAKIGGEMVSLTAVESFAEAVWPDGRHAVVSVPDDKKGERLVLVTDVVGDLIDKQEIDEASAKRILDMAMAS